MKKIKYCISISFVIWLALQVGSNCLAETQDTPDTSKSFEPRDGKVILIIGQDRDTIGDYIDSTGMIPGGFMFYTSIQRMEALYASHDSGAGIQNAQYLIEKYPNTVIQIGLYMVDALEATMRGEYDANLDKLGEWIRQANVPVYLRIGYEFDGPHNHYEPRQYVKAYRYVVDRFRENQIENVVFVWHSFSSDDSKMLMDWYPGDEFVDWFGITYFRQSEHLLIPMVELARSHEKPMMIAEATPRGLMTSFAAASSYLWETYYAPLFAFIEKHNVKMLCYINANWESQPMWKGERWGDARIQASAYIKAKWLEEIKKPLYLQSLENLFEELGYSEEKDD